MPPRRVSVFGSVSVRPTLRSRPEHFQEQGYVRSEAARRLGILLGVLALAGAARLELESAFQKEEPVSDQRAQCRALEDMDARTMAPEDSGKHAVRYTVGGTAIGDVHVLIEDLQVSLLRAKVVLERISDRRFRFNLSGADEEGLAVVVAWLEGVKVQIPGTVLEDTLKAITNLESSFHHAVTLGRGNINYARMENMPVNIKLAMSGELVTDEGPYGAHWTLVESTAKQTTKFRLGSGGFAMGLVNTAIRKAGGIDQIFFDQIWPYIIKLVPDAVGDAFQAVPHAVAEIVTRVNIKGSCPDKKNGIKCPSHQLDLDVDFSNAMHTWAKPFIADLVTKHGWNGTVFESVHQAQKRGVPLNGLNFTTRAKALLTSDKELVASFTPRVELPSALIDAFGIMETLKNFIPNDGPNLTRQGGEQLPGVLFAGALDVEGGVVTIPDGELRSLRLPITAKEELEIDTKIVGWTIEEDVGEAGVSVFARTGEEELLLTPVSRGLYGREARGSAAEAPILSLSRQFFNAHFFDRTDPRNPAVLAPGLERLRQTALRQESAEPDEGDGDSDGDVASGEPYDIVSLIFGKASPLAILSPGLMLALTRRGATLDPRGEHAFRLSVSTTGVADYLRSWDESLREQANPRTGPEGHGDGRVPERFQKPHAREPAWLHLRHKLARVSAAIGVDVTGGVTSKNGMQSELLTFRLGARANASLRLDRALVRGALEGKDPDMGYLHFVTKGHYGKLGAVAGPTRGAIVRLTCGWLELYKLDDSRGAAKGPFMSSAWLTLDLANPDDWSLLKSGKPVQVDEIMYCFRVKKNRWLGKLREKHVCMEGGEAAKLQEALVIQRRRLVHAREVQEANCSKRPSMCPAWPDGTWYVDYELFNPETWFPDLPPPRSGRDVVSPREEWRAVEDELD